MSSEFPIFLAWAFLGSLVLGLLKTSRWVAVLISILALWGACVEQKDIDLVTAGMIEGYVWFGVRALAIWIPAIAVSLIGCDIGAAALSFLRKDEKNESEDAPEEMTEQAPE